ncbi:MAG: tryptophan-rich sensory protein [Rhodocyclaceae bacterium]|nr:tryptophan-rich sensory protein [Rhodocyclaceae bacterium]
MGRRGRVLALPGFILLALSAGLAGSRWLPGMWYVGLTKPSWNPPAWVFGPVWTFLYVTMGVAAWLVWRRAGWRGARGALLLFGLQLGLNALWSYVFFGAHLMGWGLVEMLVLWAAILATARAFARHSRTAGWLLAPYLAWVAFAAVLNFTLWRLNA